MTTPVEMAALTIATHHISPARARIIAAHVITDLQRIGWGGRPDRIDLGWLELCAFCDRPTEALQWSRRSGYVPACAWHLDADGATGGTE